MNSKRLRTVVFGRGIMVGVVFLAASFLTSDVLAKEALTKQDKQMLSWCRKAAGKIAKVMEGWVKKGTVTKKQLFNAKYTPIPNTNPQKYHTAYDKISDKDVSPIQETYFAKSPEILYLVLVDRNGYNPTHNKKYTRPLTGNMKVDRKANRTKRKFDDPIGLAQARNTKPYLLQKQTRGDKTFKALSVPIFLFKKHWGALRVGYRPK